MKTPILLASVALVGAIGLSGCQKKETPAEANTEAVANDIVDNAVADEAMNGAMTNEAMANSEDMAAGDAALENADRNQHITDTHN